MSAAFPTTRPSHGKSNFWTPANIERLADLWFVGHSTADIAERLGTSKNSVVGKAHRQFHLGDVRCTPRASPINRTGKPGYRKPRSAARRVRKPAPTLTEISSDTTAPRTTPLAFHAYAGAKECQYPIGNPGKPGFRLCDDDRMPMRPYCHTHCCHTHCCLAYVGFGATPAGQEIADAAD